VNEEYELRQMTLRVKEDYIRDSPTKEKERREVSYNRWCFDGNTTVEIRLFACNKDTRG